MSGYAESTFSSFNVADFQADVCPLPEVEQGSVFENTIIGTLKRGTS